MNVHRMLTINYRLNIMGLIAGLFLVYVAVSDEPWWILIGGSVKEHAFSAEISPFRTAITILCKPVDIPIVTYMNMGLRLSFLLMAATTILGSIFMKTSWSGRLISLAGFITPLAFPILLYISLEVVKMRFGITIPMIGRSNLTYKMLLEGREIVIHAPVIAEMSKDYWTALIIGIPSLVAKLIHSCGMTHSSRR